MSVATAAEIKRLPVGIGQLVVTTSRDDVLVAYGLGSCVGITAFDPVVGVAGMAHVLLPTSDGRLADSREPARFADTAVTALLNAMTRAGARPTRLMVKLAGGASVLGPASSATFKIGDRNAETIKEQLKLHGLIVTATDLGGVRGRTLELHASSGKTFVRQAASMAVEF